MNWAVEFTHRSRKQFRKLGTSEQKGIANFLSNRVALREDPRELAIKLSGLNEEVWRFRVGNCRVLVQFEDEIMTILVIAVGNRGDIYR